jgi:soluble lytic murein transglycosylase-like protein
MALERVMGRNGTPLQAVSMRGGLAATAASASGEASRDKTHTQVEGFRPLIEQAAKRYNLDRALLAAVVHVESGGNPKAVSPAGAQGLTQLMPSTAQYLGVQNPFDPAQSLDGAAKYLRKLLGQFAGNVAKALAAYNAGEGNVKKYGGIPPFAETQAYVPSVLAAYATYRQSQPAPSGGESPLRRGASQHPLEGTAAAAPGGALTPAASFRLSWLLDVTLLRSQRSRSERQAG